MTGMSFRFYDPTTDEWAIYWTDSRRPGALDPAGARLALGDVGVFEGRDRSMDGRSSCGYMVGRLDHDPTLGAGVLDDDGETWETNWIMEFTPVGRPSTSQRHAQAPGRTEERRLCPLDLRVVAARAGS